MENKQECIIAKGLSVSPGVADGRVYIHSSHNTRKVTRQDILVLKSSDPTYAVDVMQAGGLIVEIGGRLSHLCIIALEMGIPCITQVNKATSVLKDEEQIVLCANKGEVYGRKR